MKKILFIIQSLLKFSLIFFISFIWLRYLIKSLLLATAISFIISVAIEILLYFFKKKSNLKKELKFSEKEDAENMFLSLLTNTNYIDFYLNLVKSRHQSVLKKRDYIIIKHKDNTKVLLIPIIKIEMLTPNNIIEISKINKTEKADKIVVLCYDFDKHALSFSKNFDYEILILDRFDTYSHLYKEYDYFPEITIKYKKEAKLSFKELLAYSFNKSRTKGYIFASILLFITSFFIPLNIYYCIMASILLLFALISFINPKYNIKNTKNII